MAYVSQTTKKQVTARMTPQFAKDLNLIMACTGSTNASGVVQDAVHQLAEYYRFAMQRNNTALQDVEQEV
jgi:hypothetical protein